MKIALGLIAVALSGCTNESLDVAPNVDLQQFQGKWFEIARLPRVTESDCTRTTAYYTMVSGSQLTMVNECHLGDPNGAVRSVSTTARVPDTSVPAKLSLDFGAFYGDYWIIDVGQHYEYAVVGHPTRQYLWILSRKPTLDPPVLNGILQRAHDKKFETSRLEYTQQLASDGDPGQPEGPEVPPSAPPSYGCSISTFRTSGPGFMAGIFCGVGLLFNRRRSRRTEDRGIGA
jgi:apolipoprotein D and lipocalin family protein